MSAYSCLTQVSKPESPFKPNPKPWPPAPCSGAGFPAAEKQDLTDHKGSIKTHTGVKAGLNLELGHTEKLSQCTGDRKLVLCFAPYQTKTPSNNRRRCLANM